LSSYRPGPGGKPCDGESKERDICSTQPCVLTKSYSGLLTEQCNKMEDDKWTLYLDRDFQKRCK